MAHRNDFEKAIDSIQRDDPKLTEFSLGFWSTVASNTKIPMLANALKTNTHLVSLDLSWCVISPHEQALAQGLAVNKGLRFLDLRYAQKSNQGLLIIAASLCHSKALRELHLVHRTIDDSDQYHFPFQPSTIALESCVELGDDFNDQLTLISQDQHATGTVLGHSLFVLFASGVEILNLHGTKLSDLDIAYLSLLIAKSTTLKELILDDIRSAADIKMLAAGLKHNHSLKRLVIRNAGNEGEKHLAAMLQHNQTLESLEIDSGEMGGEGENALLAALKHNTGLLKLDTGWLTFSNDKLLQEYLIRNRLIKFLDIMSYPKFVNEDGTLSEVDFACAQALIEDFATQNSSLALSKQLPVILASLKSLLEGKSVKLNLLKLLTCDVRVRPVFLRVFAQQMLRYGDFLHAIIMIDSDSMDPKQRLLLVDAMLRDEELYKDQEILTIQQRCQLGFVMLRDALAYDRSDMITLRRLICLATGYKGKDVPSLKTITGADYVVTLETFMSALNALRAASDSEEFKAHSVDIISEANFQALLVSMKNEMIRLASNKIEIPEVAKFIQQYEVIRCYEMVALYPDAGNDIDSIIRAQTRALRLKEISGDVASRFAQLCENVKSCLIELKTVVESNLIQQLVALVMRGINTFLASARSENRGIALSHKNNLSSQPTLDTLVTVMDNAKEGLKQAITEELQNDDLAAGLHKLQLQTMIDNAIKGIEYYQQLDRKSLFTSHLNIFAMVFDNDRGVLRANAYKRILSDTDRDVDQKVMVLYSLLKSNDGKKLQECVKNHIGFGDAITPAFASYLKSQDPNINLAAVTGDVFNVANDKPDEMIDLGMIATRSYMKM